MPGLDKYFRFLFPVVFIGMWFFVTTTLAKKSGWYALAKRYPDRMEPAIRKLRFQSGWVGSVSMSGILRLEACSSGLRVGIWKIFGPFSRDFFVPWSDVHVERTRRFIWNVAKLNFDEIGTLILFDYAANRLARSSSGHWPEAGSFQKDNYLEATVQAAKVWLVGVIFVAGFFTLAPLLLTGGKQPFLFPTPIIVAGTIMVTVAAFLYFLARIRE
jgi:hypothetical protein